MVNSGEEATYQHRMLAQLRRGMFRPFFQPDAGRFHAWRHDVHINATYAEAPITSLISGAISPDNAVVWYNHWEDGYDMDVGVATASTTEIWGDGDAANGFAPSVTTYTNSTHGRNIDCHSEHTSSTPRIRKDRNATEEVAFRHSSQLMSCVELTLINQVSSWLDQ